jgi:hypothetical protein
MNDPIRALSRHLAAHAESPVAREAAEKTGGVPVYSDVGGTLVVTATGEVLEFDSDTGVAETVADPRWRLAALARGARSFGELAAFAPVRPTTASTCPACGGRGIVLESLDCGTCMGLGWL